jgi:hypothetical protein
MVAPSGATTIPNPEAPWLATRQGLRASLAAEALG